MPYHDHPRPRPMPHDARRSPEGGLQIRGLAQGLDGARDGLSYDEDAHGRHSHDAYDGRDAQRHAREDHRAREHQDHYDHHDRHHRYRSRSPRRDHQSHERDAYRDRDREGYRSPHRSPSRNGRRDRSPSVQQPTREIHLDGVSPDMTEDDIASQLQRRYNAGPLADVRVIRERWSGASKGFAFVRFDRLEDAERWSSDCGPFIYLSSPSAHQDDADFKVYLNYTKERADRPDRPGQSQDDWMCGICGISNYARRTECFKCHSPRKDAAVVPNAAAPAHVQTFPTGDTDISHDEMPSQFLLFRNLDANTSVELLAKGAQKLCRSAEDDQPEQDSKLPASTTANNGASPKSILRAFVVRDAFTSESWRYGFIEFSSVEDARAALAKSKTIRHFTVSSKEVLVSFIHAGVFVPVDGPATSDADERTFRATLDPTRSLAYWNTAAYVQNCRVHAPPKDLVGKPKPNEKTTTATEPKKKKRRVDDPAAAAAAALSSSSSTAPKKAMAPQLQYWTNRGKELRGANPTNQDAPTAHAANPNDPDADKDTAPDAPESFADEKNRACWLCRRTFPNIDVIYKHERLTAEHKRNLADPAKVAAARAELERVRREAIAAGEAPPQRTYRDRAQERRAEAPTTTARPTANAADDSAPRKKFSMSLGGGGGSGGSGGGAAQSKGAALLGKMGWTAGTGLGAGSAGAQAPVETSMYAAGVGLGAAGGRVGDAADEAGRRTRGERGEYTAQARDKARERFERM